MKNIIEIKNLLVQRNKRDVLKIDSLNIVRGETFLLALAGLIKPRHGELIFNGKNQNEWNELEYRRKIAFVFQDPLLMDMTVAENIALGLKFRGLKDTQQAVLYWSKAIGVESLLTRRASQLSGGEAQRVSLARAFVLRPDLLLMDEPFSAVDPQMRSQLLRDLAKVLEKEKSTTIFVTHNLREATQFGDKIIVIIDGELKQIGSAKHIKEKPADKKVKTFTKGLRL